MHTHVSLVLGVHAFNCPHARFQLHLNFLKILLGPVLRNGSAESFPGWSFVVPPSSLGCYFACHFLHRRLLFVRWVPVAPSIFQFIFSRPSSGCSLLLRSRLRAFSRPRRLLLLSSFRGYAGAGVWVCLIFPRRRARSGAVAGVCALGWWGTCMVRRCFLVVPVFVILDLQVCVCVCVCDFL